MDFSSFAFLLPVAQDALFAAIAGVGFAMASNPARRALPFIALVAAVGHALRFVLQEGCGVDITSASFCAALAIGFLGVPLAKRIKCPAGPIAFPALLPMVPGLYAYNAVLALVRFNRGGSYDGQVSAILAFFDNGLTTLFVMCALVVGILIPIQIFKRVNFTRGAAIR